MVVILRLLYDQAKLNLTRINITFSRGVTSCEEGISIPRASKIVFAAEKRQLP